MIGHFRSDVDGILVLKEDPVTIFDTTGNLPHNCGKFPTMVTRNSPSDSRHKKGGKERGEGEEAGTGR